LHSNFKMPYGKRRKGKHSGRSTPSSGGDKPNDAAPLVALPLVANVSEPKNDTSVDSMDIILTSNKRRGVYECDYCHSDISQLPRIRCAVCPDFDLCLDCFATTDHTAAISRLKAAASAHGLLLEEGTGGLGASGVSSAAVNHDDTHGYRVCDSTRYPLFPSSRNILASKANSTVDDRASEAGGDDAASVTRKEPSTGNQVENNQKITEAAGDSMEVEPTGSTKAEATKDTNNALSNGEKESVSTALVAAVSNTNVFEDAAASDVVVVQDDPRSVWSVEEDLRLLEGLRHHGLGNWTEISESVSGQGSTGKTPRRCMERYFDDFLGRYGYILPPYMLTSEEEEEPEGDKESSVSIAEGGETPRSSKRRAVMLRSPSSVSNTSLLSRKKFKAVPTDAVPGFDQVWPNPYLPPVEGVGVQMGQDVGRDQAYKSELLYVKMSSAIESHEEAEKLRKEWTETKLNKPGGPTVLPPRPNDVVTLPGAELEGFMPRRGDFDVEWENDAEHAVADMEFLPGESAQDKQLKLQVLAIYSSKLDARETRKKFVLSRGLLNYRKNHTEDQNLPRDERDLVHRMRLFERFHTPMEHKRFLDDIIKAKRLRKEIAKLQMYRRIGIRTLAEAEKYELDKTRRQFHKVAQVQKETETNKSEAAGGSATTGDATTKNAGSKVDDFVSSSLWKQYRPSYRKARKSLNRGESRDGESSEKVGDGEETKASQPETDAEKSDRMDIDKNPEVGDGPKADTPGERVDAMDVEVGGKADNPSNTDPCSEREKDEKESVKADALAHLPGYTLLSPKEVALCRNVGFLPAQYLEIKKALIHESMVHGLLDKESPGSSRRTLVKIDVERRGGVIDFMVKAGWISTKLGHLAGSLPTAGAKTTA
jgi:hypothetical protein